MSLDSHMLGSSKYERSDLDYYPTPRWVTEALLQSQIASILRYREKVWEPACGAGHMSEVLSELYGSDNVISTDIVDRGYCDEVFDFLKADNMPDGVHSIITNPPYGELAEAFIRHAIKLILPVDGSCHFLLRNEYDCSKKRMDLFQSPFYAGKTVLTKRPRWIEGSTGAPRHNYAWFHWEPNSPDYPVIEYYHPDLG